MTARIQFTSPRVGERGRSPSGGVSNAPRPRYAALLAAVLALSACVASQTDAAVQAQGPGFLEGLWHGFIFPVAWVFSLFMDKVSVYAVPNNGGWYDFGYFLGIVVFGVGARKSRVIYRDRSNVIEAKAKRVEEVGL